MCLRSQQKLYEKANALMQPYNIKRGMYCKNKRSEGGDDADEDIQYLN